MECKALKAFDSKPLQQHIRAGVTFHCSTAYGRDLARNKLVEILAQDEPGPGSNKAIPVAPGRSGKEQAPPPPAGPVPASTGGQVQRSQSSQAGRASPAKTVTTSSVGGRRGQVKKKVASTPIITPEK